MIETIIADIKQATGLDVFAERTTKKKECIIYSLTKEQDNGAVAQWRLTISLLTKTVKKAREIKDIVDNILITKGDERKYYEILECYQNGGGVLYDEDSQFYETISYYDFISKSKIEWR